MKKIVLCMTLVSVLLSCKKSNSGSSGYHMTAGIAGKSTNFNFAPPMAKATVVSDHLTGVDITGYLNSNNVAMFIRINSLDVSKPIVAGTYTDTTASFFIQVVYSATLADQYYGGTGVAYDFAAAGTPVKNHTKIVITSVDDKAVKGTFTGDLYDIDPTPIPLVNGDFYAAFAN